MHTIRLDISNDIYDKVMFILENLPKNKVKLHLERDEDTNNSKLDKFRELRKNSNNQTNLTMKIATSSDEMVDDGIF